MSDHLTIGTDPVAPSATRGYSLNHFALIVSDMKLMRHFYGDVLGMRHIVTHQISPTYDITYMGYPVDKSGYQTGQEMLRELRYRDGLLEFLHPSNGGKGSTAGRIGRFSHMGIVVPDVKAAEQRMRDCGVPILKALGEENINPGSTVAEWWGLDSAHAAAAAAGAKEIEWASVLLVTDPEGNVVEVQERK